MKKKVRITVGIPEELLPKLRYLANQEHRTVSGLVRLFIRQKIEAFERENGEIST